MSSGIIDIIKRVAVNAFEASNPVKLLFGTVISTDPYSIEITNQEGRTFTIDEKFLVVIGDIAVDEHVSIIRCQGGQKYIVLGTRTVYVESEEYTGGGEVAVSDGTWQLPFKGGYRESSPFWQLRTRSDGTKYHHTGVDLVGTDKNIYPVNNGTVVLAAMNGGYGNCVIVEHGNDYWSLYAHFSELYVKKGQSVNKNTILGHEGSTGNSTGSHLHLEIRKGANSSSNVINPLEFLGVK